MAPSLRSLLAGPAVVERQGWHLELFAVVPVFAVVFGAYALGFFEIAGGVVFVPGDAALVGLVAGVVVGYLGRGLLLAWLVAYAALLGNSADHYLFGISARPFLERIAAMLGPDGLVAYALMALVIGTLAWVVGFLARRTVGFVRGRGLAAGSENP